MRVTSIENKFHQINHLTEAYDIIDTPVGFKDIVLYPHQATVIRAMLDLEDKRVVELVIHKEPYFSITSSYVSIQSSAMVLSEPFGSGKTFEILGLILCRPIPRAIPPHANYLVMTSQVTRYERGKRVENFKHEIVKMHTGPSKLIRANLIVVGSSVLLQWEGIIKKHTNLRVFVVGNYYSLTKFYEYFGNKLLWAFDVILLKNGTVTGNFKMPGDDPSKVRDLHSLVSAIGKITTGYCWARVIYDDFDTIKIPVDADVIDSLFTVYVSATMRETPTGRYGNNHASYKNVEQILREKIHPLTYVTKDATLFTNFNIRNAAAYVEESTHIPIINKYAYVYKNPDDNYIRLIGAMGEVDADKIMEMLNGDAISTAAEELGMKTTSVADIFQKMLDNKYEKFLRDQKVLEVIDQTIGTFAVLESHPEGRNSTIAELENIRASIDRATVPRLKFACERARETVLDMQATYRMSYEQNKISIDRMISNIKEGSCQICCLPLECSDTFIVRCCGLIVCDQCGIKGNQMFKRYDHKIKSETISGACANCKKAITFNDLIFIDRNFDLNALLTAKGDEAEKYTELSAAAVEPEPEHKIKNPKLRALIELINGSVPSGRAVVNVKIPQLLEGRFDIPSKPGDQQKILVFANFNETLQLVEKCLHENGVEYLRLGGTFGEMAKTIDLFRTSSKVLLINSQHQCAGINIPFATDIVFMHKIIDPSTESQVCGRGQRIGRTCNLRIHYILYKNEQGLLNR